MIAVSSLTKDYKDGEVVTHALRGISFTITPGEFVSIMGPSGSGKSTLLHILSFLDRPTGGSYTFNNKNIADFSDDELAHIRNIEMGFVFQSFNLLSRASVYENVELPLIYTDMPHHTRRERVEQAIAAVGLTEKTTIEAGRLSGGQKQRAAIARALVNSPDVIFADEPTGNLDSVSGAGVMEVLERLNKAGRTIILVTHETYTAAFAKRRIHIKDGMVESDEQVKERRTGREEFFK